MIRMFGANFDSLIKPTCAALRSLLVTFSNISGQRNPTLSTYVGRRRATLQQAPQSPFIRLSANLPTTNVAPTPSSPPLRLYSTSSSISAPSTPQSASPIKLCHSFPSTIVHQHRRPRLAYHCVTHPRHHHSTTN